MYLCVYVLVNGWISTCGPLLSEGNIQIRINKYRHMSIFNCWLYNWNETTIRSPHGFKKQYDTSFIKIIILDLKVTIYLLWSRTEAITKGIIVLAIHQSILCWYTAAR